MEDLLSENLDEEPQALREDFEKLVEGALEAALPLLIDRLEKAGFADWHRRNGHSRELAYRAAYEFLRFARRNQSLPDDVFRYLVKISKNLAIKDWRDRQRQPLFNSTEDVLIALTKLSVPPNQMEDEETSDSTEEALLDLVRFATERLPRRQREALRLYLDNPDATQKELGEKMQIGEDGFQKNYSRAIASLRRAVHDLISEAIPHLPQDQRQAVIQFLKHSPSSLNAGDDSVGIRTGSHPRNLAKALVSLAVWVRQLNVSAR